MWGETNCSWHFYKLFCSKVHKNSISSKSLESPLSLKKPQEDVGLLQLYKANILKAAFDEKTQRENWNVAVQSIFLRIKFLSGLVLIGNFSSN